MFDLPDVELVTDLAPAAWIEERLARWPVGPGFPVRGVVPEGFERYARILHPASRRIGEGDRRIRWAELARSHGKVAHPLMSFEAIVGGRGPEQVPAWDVTAPSEELPREEARVLARILAPHTATPEVCWFCVWAGYGSLHAGASLTYTSSGRERRRVVRESLRRGRARARELARIPQVVTHRSGPDALPARTYFLFTGRLAAVENFEFEGPGGSRSWQPPNLWWPEDRSWCVATEVDGYDTFVGGAAAAIGDVLASPALEAFPVSLDDRVDADADAINGPVPPRDR